VLQASSCRASITSRMALSRSPQRSPRSEHYLRFQVFERSADRIRSEPLEFAYPGAKEAKIVGSQSNGKPELKQDPTTTIAASSAQRDDSTTSYSFPSLASYPLVRYLLPSSALSQSGLPVLQHQMTTRRTYLLTIIPTVTLLNLRPSFPLGTCLTTQSTILL
jgi:hypothetical protein